MAKVRWRSIVRRFAQRFATPTTHARCNGPRLRAAAVGGALVRSGMSPRVGVIAGLMLCGIISSLVVGLDIARRHLPVLMAPTPALPLPEMPHAVVANRPAMVAPIAPVIAPRMPVVSAPTKPPPQRDARAAAVVTAELRAVAQAIDASPLPAREPSVPRSAEATLETTGSFHREIAKIAPPDSPELELSRATHLIEDGNTERGLSALQAYIAHHPTADEARVRYAETLLKLGQAPAAEASLRQGLAVRPEAAVLARMLGHLLFDRGDIAGALKVMRSVTPEVAADPDYYAFLAALYQRLGGYRAAAETYRQILRVRPTNGAVWIGLGISLAAAGENPEAGRAFAQAARDPQLSAMMREYAAHELARLGLSR